MTLVDAANDHHPHENLKIGDLPRVPGEKRLDGKRTIPLDDYVHPGRRNTCTRTIASWNAAASTITGVSSVLGPVYRLPSRSACSAQTNTTFGARSTSRRA